MPQLKRLVPTDASVHVAPEQLFVRALHDETHRQTRKDAAAACAARGYTMASALGGELQDDDARLQEMVMPSSGPATVSLEESVRRAILAAQRDNGTSLFIVTNAVYVAKQISRVLDTDNLDASIRETTLGRISLQQTREIHVLLSVLDGLQHHTPHVRIASKRLVVELGLNDWLCSEQRPAHVFIGPLSGFFTPFLTTGGLTTTGDGLLRIVQLACKRLLISQPLTDVTIIRDRPQFEAQQS